MPNWSRLIPRQATYGLTTVTCNADRGALDNSLGQNPCLVYAWIVGSCASVVVQVDPLNNSDNYPAPSSDPSLGVLSASKCTCERITYNLVSACAGCQNKTQFLSWDSWSSNCDNFTGQWDYTKNVPQGLALPAWATGQTNATVFDWDIAVKDTESDLVPTSTRSGVSSTLSTRPTSSTIQSAQISSISISTSVALSAASLGLFMALVVAFVLLRQKVRSAQPHKKRSSSTFLHPALMTIIFTVGLILACASTWVIVVINSGVRWSNEGQRNTLNFLVFNGWWTVLSSAYFLLGFQYDRRYDPDEYPLSKRPTRLAPIYTHFIWLIATWAGWVVLSALLVANMIRKDLCSPFCTQFRAITAFSFLELSVFSCLLISLVATFFMTIWKKPKPTVSKRSSPRERK